VLLAKSDILTGDYPGISGQTGAGIDELISRIADILSQRAAGAGVAIRIRHRDAMLKGSDYLRLALGLSKDANAADLAAEELRSAVRALDSLVGRVDIENVLDEIFASFCLGK
jgi:tRNA modification GTPase